MLHCSEKMACPLKVVEYPARRFWLCGFFLLHPKSILPRSSGMEKNFKNTISDIEPPKELKGRILARLEDERRKSASSADRRQKRKKMLLFGGFLASGIGVFSSLAFFGHEILASDFWSFASLGFSDAGVVAANWQEYALSLLETLPVFSIIAVLAPMAVVLLLMKYYADQKFSYKNNLLIA
jgi:hypothetical protein